MAYSPINEIWIASSRFGLLEPDSAVMQFNPRQWALDQVVKLKQKQPGSSQTQLVGPVYKKTEFPTENSDEARKAHRADFLENTERRWLYQIGTNLPVRERLVMFWSNHFTVAAVKAPVVPHFFDFEQTVVRDQLYGRFADMCYASTTHPAMLAYLDNILSVGASSRQGKKRGRGLNENLARELLELHTLGVRQGYTQSDVTELAKILTGWTVKSRQEPTTAFKDELHEPGSKTVLGRIYPEGADALRMVIEDLCEQPSTANHIALKLCRWMVSDTPATALVEHVARVFRQTRGDLPKVHAALLGHDLAWAHQPLAQRKFRNPEDWMLAVHRLFNIPVNRTIRRFRALEEFGQPFGRAPSPAGWPDQGAQWISPDAMLKRMNYAIFLSETYETVQPAKALDLALGSALSKESRQEVERASTELKSQQISMLIPEILRRG